MKKLLSILMAVAIMATSTAAVSAGTIDSTDGSDSEKVKATFIAPEDVYSVDIEWGSMEFVYDARGAEWNDSQHTWDYGGATGWSCATNANKVTVTNHSSTSIDVKFNYEGKAGFSAVTGSLSNESKTLTIAETGKTVLTLSGVLPATTGADTVIGTITVTLD